jgi:mxaJ protein
MTHPYAALGLTLAVVLISPASAPAPPAVGAAEPAPVPTPPRLRVCADPNNLPFSNDRLQGFENRLADLLARDLGATLSYTWWPQRRGFIRNTLDADQCDVLMGVPTGLDSVLTTAPYYRSMYVFVSKRERHLQLRSFDDPRLRRLRIGVQLIGDDGTNSPPAHALSARGIVSNVVGYTVYGDYAQPNPPAAILSAVSRGEIDAAVAWGPLAGFFAKQQKTALVLSQIVPDVDRTSLPLSFNISMAVRRGDQDQRRALDDFLARRRGDVRRLLAQFGVPQIERLGEFTLVRGLTAPRKGQ